MGKICHNICNCHRLQCHYNLNTLLIQKLILVVCSYNVFWNHLVSKLQTELLLKSDTSSFWKFFWIMKKKGQTVFSQSHKPNLFLDLLDASICHITFVPPTKNMLYYFWPNSIYLFRGEATVFTLKHFLEHYPSVCTTNWLCLVL